MTDQTTDRHTCHNQKAAAGPAWQCPRCSATPAAPLPPVVQSPIREQLLNALDFSFCQTLGFGTPEGLLAAYEASRTQTVDQAALRDRIAQVLWPLTDWDGDELNAERAADAVLAVLPATTNHDTDTSGFELRGDTEIRAAALHEAADRAEIVALRLRLKNDYGAANGAHEVTTELRRVADETAATETQAATGACTNCRGSGLDPRYNGDFACPDCQPATEPAAGARQDGAQP